MGIIGLCGSLSFLLLKPPINTQSDYGLLDNSKTDNPSSSLKTLETKPLTTFKDDIISVLELLKNKRMHWLMP